MKMPDLNPGNRLLTYALSLVLSCICVSTASAQVSPNEILNPQLKSLEAQYFPQLKAINKQIARTQFPFPFYLSRVV